MVNKQNSAAPFLWALLEQPHPKRCLARSLRLSPRPRFCRIAASGVYEVTSFTLQINNLDTGATYLTEIL